MTFLRSSRRISLAVASLAVVVASACGNSGAASTSTTTSTGSTGGAPTTTIGLSSNPAAKPESVSTTKAPLTGLVDKGQEIYYHESQTFPVTDPSEVAPDAPAFGGIVVNESWAQLEPTQGSFDFQPLDDSLAAVKTYNSQHPSDPLGVKLRIWGGLTAPSWAKQLGGSPIFVQPTDKQGRSGTVGRWWTAPYESAWVAFQDALAKAYDPVPLIREVAVSSCASATDEPFIGWSSPKVLKTLLDAGWTSAAQQSCLSHAISDYSAWKETPIDFTFNEYPDVNSKGTRLLRSPFDAQFTTEVMTQCADSGRSSPGPVCHLDNHGLQQAAPTLEPMVLGEMQSLHTQSGAVVEFQTYNGFPSLICGAIATAVTYKATSVELWPKGPGTAGFESLPESELVNLDHALTGGAQPSCS